MKRYIYIIIGIIVAAVIAILVLFLIKNNAQNTTLTPSEATTTGSLPVTGAQGTNSSGTTATVGTLGLSSPTNSSTSAANGQTPTQSFGILSNDLVLDYFVDAQNHITAIEPFGQIVSISNGQSTIVNSSTIDNIISASFSYDGKKILVSYGDPANPSGGIFDSTTNTWTALPNGMLSPQWSPINNYQIAYLAVINGGKLVLSTMNATNLKAAPSVLLSLNANDLALQWPIKNEFILSDKPTYQNAGSILVFNSQTGTLSPLMYEVPGAEGIWSHNATIPYGLVFFSNSLGQGNTLQLQAISGNLPTQSLNLKTLPSKCAFNTEQMPIATSTPTNATTTSVKIKPGAPTSTPYLALYCGIPRDATAFSSAHLPDNYNMMAFFTSDDIYKINTATGAEQVLWSDGTQNMDISDVKIFNNALFFINRYDQKLYGLTFSN